MRSPWRTTSRASLTKVFIVMSYSSSSSTTLVLEIAPLKVPYNNRSFARGENPRPRQYLWQMANRQQGPS
jgi:hypothetical protein